MEPILLYEKHPIINAKSPTYWYAVYTKPHHEKKIFEQTKTEHIEAFLPLHTTIRQWSDRKKKVSEPLFSCYLFVKITKKEYYKVLNIPGVVRYITFEGKAIPISEAQIQLIKNLLMQDFEPIEYMEHIHLGMRVKVQAGLLTGTEGILVDHSGKKRVIISIEEINKSLLINVPLNILAPF